MQSQSKETASRSDALKPLVWPFGISLTACIGLTATHAAVWTIGIAGVFACAFALLYIGAYLFFLFSNPDALRSESYTLQKMALERGLVGDSDSGFRRITPDIVALPSSEPSTVTQNEVAK